MTDKERSAIYCDHANECPQSCPCDAHCYCKSHTCKPRPAPTQAKEQVDHPSHYGGASDPYETIKVIEAWGLDFSLGNAVKYISRAGKKDPNKTVEDLQKAKWYLERAIANAKAGKP